LIWPLANDLSQEASSPLQRAYELYGHATGLPSPLLENAALYWQSKSTYRDRAEVIGVARNFSQRNLSVGMIVIAHDDVPCSPAFKNCTPPVRSSPEKARQQRTRACGLC